MAVPKSWWNAVSEITFNQPLSEVDARRVTKGFVNVSRLQIWVRAQYSLARLSGRQ
jgi:hypothetical protein